MSDTPVTVTHDPAADPAPGPDQPAQIAALQSQLDALTAERTAAAPKPERALPSVGELVTHSWVNPSNGLTATKRGIVIAVDADNRHAMVNWLPDATAQMAVDDLDP